MRSRLAFNVGLNDADYVVQRHEIVGYKENGSIIKRQVWVCPYYQTWYSMIRRCYSVNSRKTRPTYEGCEVSKEWLLFSSFKKWMEKQDWEGKQLDKDLFGNGKLYSKETCCFINAQINSFIQECSKGNSSGKRGVSWKTKNKKWVAQINDPLENKKIHIGLYDCKNEAERAYLSKKYYFARLITENMSNERIKTRLLDKCRV